jgi:hypothetical protein
MRSKVSNLKEEISLSDLHAYRQRLCPNARRRQRRVPSEGGVASYQSRSLWLRTLVWRTTTHQCFGWQLLVVEVDKVFRTVIDRQENYSNRSKPLISGLLSLRHFS